MPYMRPYLVVIAVHVGHGRDERLPGRARTPSEWGEGASARHRSGARVRSRVGGRKLAGTARLRARSDGGLLTPGNTLLSGDTSAGHVAARAGELFSRWRDASDAG